MASNNSGAPNPRASVVTNAPDGPETLGDFAVQQAQNVVVLTSSFLSTLITVLGSAFALVAALAWNSAISAWLAVVFPHNNHIASLFIYAGSVTVLAVVLISILGLLHKRIRGQNMLALTQ